MQCHCVGWQYLYISALPEIYCRNLYSDSFCWNITVSPQWQYNSGAIKPSRIFVWNITELKGVSYKICSFYFFIALKKKRPWANRSRHSLQKSNHEQIALDLFFICFWQFFTVFPSFYAKRANRSQCSLLSCSFLKINGSDSITSLYTKEQPWANPSFTLSITKNERFAQKSDYRIPNPDFFMIRTHPGP